MTTISASTALDMALAATKALKEEITNHEDTKLQLAIAIEDLRTEENRRFELESNNYNHKYEGRGQHHYAVEAQEDYKEAQASTKPWLYSLGRPYITKCGHNAISFAKIVALFKENDGEPQGFFALATAIGSHNAPGGVEGFIDYCCKHGWLIVEDA